MIDNIKELLETQRGKGLVKLGLFLAFFLIIFIYYGFTSEVPRVKPKDALESFGEMTNYEYIYTLNDITYNGKAYHSKLYFAIDSNEYLVDDNTYLKNIDGEYIITELDKLYYYDNISIYDLIKNGSVVSKTEDFEISIICSYTPSVIISVPPDTPGIILARAITIPFIINIMFSINTSISLYQKSYKYL